MLLGRPLWDVFGHQRLYSRLVFVGILPGQNGVARQHAVVQRVEARELGAAGLGRQRPRPFLSSSVFLGSISGATI